jgi:hypothetical protein
MVGVGIINFLGATPLCVCSLLLGNKNSFTATPSAGAFLMGPSEAKRHIYIVRVLLNTLRDE